MTRHEFSAGFPHFDGQHLVLDILEMYLTNQRKNRIPVCKGLVFSLICENKKPMSNLKNRFWLALLVSWLPMLTVVGEAITNTTFDFTFTLPPGFVEAERPKPTSPKIRNLYTFVEKSTVDEKPATIIQITDMRGQIGQEPLGKGYIEYLKTLDMKNITMEHIEWNGLMVEMVTQDAPTPEPDIRMCSVQVQLPVKKSAMIVGTGGSVEKRVELKRLLKSFLKAFHANTNWIRKKWKLTEPAK